MRSIEQIQEEILQAKENEPALKDLNSTSKVAVWRLWVYTISFIIYTLEKYLDKHKADVNYALEQQKVHTLRWYRNKALDFQDGFNLLKDSDKFDNKDKTQQEIEASKIVKYSAVIESTDKSTLVVKIATESVAPTGKLSPLTKEQYTRFSYYINEIKDAGVNINVINYKPDMLILNMKIYCNPLVIDKQGMTIDGEEPIKQAIEQYLKELPFNGALILAHLIDKLQEVEGVKIPHLMEASSYWIEGTSYGIPQPIDVQKIAISGYYQVDWKKSNISYISE